MSDEFVVSGTFVRGPDDIVFELQTVAKAKLTADKLNKLFDDRHAIAAPAVPAAQPGEPDAFQIMIAMAGLKSGNEGAIKLAFQLAGVQVQSCETCGYIANKCRCVPVPAATLFTDLAKKKQVLSKLKGAAALLERARYVKFSDLPQDVQDAAEMSHVQGRTTAIQDAIAGEQSRLVAEALAALAAVNKEPKE